MMIESKKEREMYQAESYRANSARLKIQAPMREIIEEILKVLEDNFTCVTSPIIRSSDGGYHTFCNIVEAEIDRKDGRLLSRT